MKTLTLLFCLSLSLSAQAAPSANSGQAPPPSDGRSRGPNIILLLVDDMGYGDIAAHGNPLIKTPNFDRLHDESVRFTDFLVSPTCSPTRAALLSGMHELKVGVSHTIMGRNRMDPEAVILPQVL
jgi:arylsulfatase A-like enzyme